MQYISNSPQKYIINARTGWQTRTSPHLWLQTSWTLYFMCLGVRWLHTFLLWAAPGRKTNPQLIRTSLSVLLSAAYWSLIKHTTFFFLPRQLKVLSLSMEYIMPNPWSLQRIIGTYHAHTHRISAKSPVLKIHVLMELVNLQRSPENRCWLARSFTDTDCTWRNSVSASVSHLRLFPPGHHHFPRFYLTEEGLVFAPVCASNVVFFESIESQR